MPKIATCSGCLIIYRVDLRHRLTDHAKFGEHIGQWSVINAIVFYCIFSFYITRDGVWYVAIRRASGRNLGGFSSLVFVSVYFQEIGIEVLPLGLKPRHVEKYRECRLTDVRESELTKRTMRKTRSRSQNRDLIIGEVTIRMTGSMNSEIMTCSYLFSVKSFRTLLWTTFHCQFVRNQTNAKKSSLRYAAS